MRADRTTEGETLVSQRQDELQFPLRPYTLTYRSAQESRKWDGLARVLAKNSGLPLESVYNFLNGKV